MNSPDISRVLRAVLLSGIGLSLALMLAGLVLLLGQPARALPGRELADYMAALRQGQPRGLLFLGLAVLALAPLLGLLAQIIAFGLRREWLFAVVALLVLLLTSAALILAP